MPAYGKANIDKMKNEHEHDRFDNKRPWRAVPGTNRLRLLPPHVNADGSFLIRGGRHWGVAKFPVYCPKEFHVSKKCFICDQVAELSRSRNPNDRAEAQNMQVQSIWRANVVDLDHINLGIQFADFGYTINEGFQSYIDFLGDISDMDEGYNFIVSQTGSGQYVKYSVMIPPKEMVPSRVPDVIRALVEEGGLYDLVAMAEIRSEEELEMLYEGRNGGDDADDFEETEEALDSLTYEDEDADEEPVVAPRATTRPTRRAPEPEPEFDADEDEVPEEEEEVQAPVTRTRAAPAAPMQRRVSSVLERHSQR